MRVEYKIIRSSRKTMAIEIKPDGRVYVRIPNRISDRQARNFVESKADWLKKNLEKIELRNEEKGTAPSGKFFGSTA